MDDGLTYASVALIPLIVGVIELLKRVLPSVSGNVWLGLSVLFGIASQSAVYIAENGLPADFPGWLTLLVMGLAFGLAASKAYDETIGTRS